jgi:hypothetical protein
MALTIDANDVDFDLLVTFRTAGGIAQMWAPRPLCLSLPRCPAAAPAT